MLGPHRRKTLASSGPLSVLQTFANQPTKMKHQSHHHQTSTLDILLKYADQRRSKSLREIPGARVGRGADFRTLRFSLALVLVAVFLAQIQLSRASIWPFGAGSSHKLSESSKRVVHSQSNGANHQSTDTGAALQPPSPPPTLSQQFHYFWNHDKMEPRVVAQEASRILNEVQLHTNHKALLESRRSSDGASPSSATGAADTASSESALEPVAALGPAALQQLTGLVLQMQRQLQQQTSLLAQPRLDMQSRLIQPGGAIPLAQPASRFWSPQMAQVMSAKLLPAESVQLASAHPLIHPLAAASMQPMSQLTLPGTNFAGVPVYGPYAIQQAPSLIRPTMIRARSMNFPTPTASSSGNYSNQKGSRRKSWPFSPFADHRIPFFMNSAASQPKVTVVGPPATYSASQRSSLINTRPAPFGVPLSSPDKQTLLEATSSQLAAAISSHLQARAAQQRLVSLLSQVIEQPASKHQTKDMLAASSYVNAHFTQPDEANAGVAGRLSYLLPSTLNNAANQIEFPSAQPHVTAPLSMVDLNNSSNSFGNRLNRRQLNSFTPENFTMKSGTQDEELLKASNGGNSSRVDMLESDSSQSSSSGRVKRAISWSPSGFMPMESSKLTSTLSLSTPTMTSSTMPKQARFLRASPSTSLTSESAASPLLIRRNLANSSAAPQEQMTTVSSLQIPDSPLDWSTPTKRSQLFKSPKVKRLVSSASVMHQSVLFPAKPSALEATSSVIAGEPSKLSALQSGPIKPIMSSFKPQEDIMSASAAESARVINYFQNVDTVDRTTTKAPEPASETMRPITSGQSSMDFSSTVNRYKSGNRKALVNETSDNNNTPNGSQYISGARGNGLQALSGANYVPHHSASGGMRGQARQQVSSAGNNGATPDISSSASRSVVYSVTNSAATSGDPTASKPGQLGTSSSKIGSGNHALVGSITRTSANSNQLMQQMDSSLSDMDGQDLQLKLLDSLIAREHSGRSSSSYVTTPPPPQVLKQQQSQQVAAGNDRSPSADQSGSYNEEMLPPSLGSTLGSDQSFQDALVDHQSPIGSGFGEMNQQDLKQSSMDSGVSQMTESTRQQSPMQQSLAPDQSQQTYNMTPGEWISGPVSVEQPMEISSNSFQNLNQLSQGYPEEQSQFYSQNYPILGAGSNNPLLYQPSIQRQFYDQQLQALGSAVNRYNKNRFNYQQASFAIPKNYSPKEMYAPMLRNDFNNLNWANIDETLLHQSAMIPQSVAYGNQNFASTMNFAGAVGGPNVNDARNYLMAGSEQSRSGQGYETGSSKSKVSKSSKPIKQVSHHYHINNFGFPVEDVDNPLDIASAFSANPGLSYPMNQQQKPAKSHKQEEEKQNDEQEEEEEKPKKKKFLRRFSFKNLFKKLKKDKKKENVEQGSDEDTGNAGGGEESSDERRSKLY